MQENIGCRVVDVDDVTDQTLRINERLLMLVMVSDDFSKGITQPARTEAFTQYAPSLVGVGTAYSRYPCQVPWYFIGSQAGGGYLSEGHHDNGRAPTRQNPGWTLAIAAAESIVSGG